MFYEFDLLGRGPFYNLMPVPVHKYHAVMYTYIMLYHIISYHIMQLCIPVSIKDVAKCPSKPPRPNSGLSELGEAR